MKSRLRIIVGGTPYHSKVLVSNLDNDCDPAKKHFLVNVSVKNNGKYLSDRELRIGDDLIPSKLSTFEVIGDMDQFVKDYTKRFSKLSCRDVLSCRNCST